MEPSKEEGQPQTEVRDISKIVSRLRVLAPIKMRRIDQIRQERAMLLNTLQRDNQEHFLGADRFHTIMEYKGTEWGMVNEVLEEVTGGNFVTGNLWGEVLAEMGTHLDIGRRTQIYAKLLDARGHKPLATKRIEKVLGQLEKVDPEIKERAADENFFRENMMDMQSGVIKDTLGNMF